MKKVAWACIVLAFIAILVGGYFAGEAGLIGEKYWYFQCEHGYATYPYGVTDSSNTYYNSLGKEIGECHSWIAGPTCEPAKKIVGECDKKGVVRWAIVKH